MRPFLQSPLAWLALVCAVLSAGLWDWSRRQPESHWESSTAALPSPAAEPALTDAQPASQPGDTPAPAQPTPAVAAVKETANSAPEPTPAATPVSSPDSSPIAAAAPPTPAATPTPTPSDAALAGPLPANPEPAASPSAQPSPAVAVIPSTPLDFAEIARQPELWPKQILLLTPVRFPVILNGVNIGNVQVTPGRAVLLRKVNSDGTVEIGLQGSPASPARVKAEMTDLLARAQTLAAARNNAAPAPQPGSSPVPLP